MKSVYWITGFFLVLGCTTKSDLRREEELERLRQDVNRSKANKADFEVVIEETKNEMARLSNAVGEGIELHRRDTEEIKKELQALTFRMQAVEQRAVQEELGKNQLSPSAELPKTFEGAKKLLDEGKFEEAVEAFQGLAKGGTSEARKSQFYLGEAYFGKKDYASAALEYNEFRKRAGKDPLIASAIYKQALSFKGMGKMGEARLFFQDLIDRYPKSPFAQKAKAELKKLK